LLCAGALLAVAFVGCWGSDGYPPLERERIGYSNHESYFPIETGTVHSRPDCAACHGGTATFLEFTCITCHEHEQAHTDSLHWSVDNYVYAATSCFDCHPSGTAAGVDHTAFFPIGPGTTHSAQHCLDCHADPADRRIFTCISCHDHSAELMDPAHSGVNGYVFDSAACLSCHPRAEVMTRAQHQIYFPIATGRHALACGDCHTTSGDYARFECFSCHSHTCEITTPEHREVRNFTCVDSECYRCHPTGRGED